MSRNSSRSAGERIVNFCFGALACAICLTLAVDLLRAIWPWLVGAGIVIGALAGLVAWLRRERSPW